MTSFKKIVENLEKKIQGVPLKSVPFALVDELLFKINSMRKITGLKKILVQTSSNLDNPLSVIFFTTHKCASTFLNKFFDLALKNSQYQFIDYSQAIESLGNKLNIGDSSDKDLQEFLEKSYSNLFFLNGKIYGPQRYPLNFPGREKFKHIFFLRDPRDVLVSSYFSLVLTHPEPANVTARGEFIARRQVAQEQGIDKYALENAKTWIIPLYNQYKVLRETSENHIYLKYDLFAENTEDFVVKISSYLGLDLSKKDIEIIVREADPIQKTETSGHKRSGKTAQYLEKLQPETINILNQELSGILNYWEIS